MQRIRKERSPAPAYVMPSSYCQPAPTPFCLLEREGELSPRPQYREPQENSDRADIDLRPIICMLIVRRRWRSEQYSRSRELPKPISFNPPDAEMRYANMSQECVHECKGARVLVQIIMVEQETIKTIERSRLCISNMSIVLNYITGIFIVDYRKLCFVTYYFVIYF